MAPGDLPRRVGVAVVGIPTVLGLLLLGGWILAVPLAVFAALGAREVHALAEARGGRPLGLLGMGAAAGLVLVAAATGAYGPFAAWALVLLAATTALGLTVALGARPPAAAPLGAVAVPLFAAAYAGLSLAVVPLLHGLPAIRAWGGDDPSRWLGALVVALPLASTWVGDAAAYFAGSTWGRTGRKLAPTISPNKSWVGSVFGLLGAGAAAAAWWAVVAPFLPGAPVSGLAAAALMGVVLGVGAQVGDLAESLLKREAGVKDSGTIFPGHGGVLDRLDALVFTLPLAYVMLALAGGAR